MIMDDNHYDHVDFLIKDGYLFRGFRLYISHTSFRDFIIGELHAGGIASHFRCDKNVVMLENQFYLPSFKKRCSNCISVSHLSTS